MYHTIIYLFVNWFWYYYITSEVDYLGVLVHDLVVSSESFESVYPDPWLESNNMTFIYMTKLICKHIYTNMPCHPNIKSECQKHCVKISQ